MKKRTTVLRDSFEAVLQVIRYGEASLVNLIAALAPWLAPLAPAGMTYANTREQLGFSPFLAWSTAIVVESIGITIVSTWVAFGAHNRKYKGRENRVSVAVPVISFVLYLVTVVVVNVLMEIPDAENGYTIAARACLTLLTVPAALLLSVRQQHTELLLNLQKRREERSDEVQKEVTVTSEPVKWTKELVLSKPEVWDELLKGRPRELAYRYGTSEHTIYSWRTEIKQRLDEVDN
jgi:hypothetical protein